MNKIGIVFTAIIFSSIIISNASAINETLEKNSQKKVAQNNSESIEFTYEETFFSVLKSFYIAQNETKTFVFNISEAMLNESYGYLNITVGIHELEEKAEDLALDIEIEVYDPNESLLNASTYFVTYNKSGLWRVDVKCKDMIVSGISNNYSARMGIGITLNRYSLESFPLPYIKNGTLDLFVVTGDNDSEEVIAESKVFIESLHAFAPNDTSVINRTFSSLNDIEKKSKNLIIIGTVENNTWSNPLMQEIWQNHSNETVTFGNESGNIKILDKDGKIVENNISERTHYALISTIRDNNRQIMLVGGLDSNATIAALKAMTNESKKNDIFGKGGRGVVINWTDVNNNSIIEIPEIRITLPAPTPAFPFVPITPPNEPPEPPEQPTTEPTSQPTSQPTTQPTEQSTTTKTTFQSAPQLTIGKPYQNAVFEVMEYISNVFGGNTINHSFKNMKTDILNISFYALFTPKYLLMKVQVLNNTPDNISAPSGKIYKNINIFLEGLSKKHVKNVKINFRVEKSWISDNNINSATIQLVRYNISKWEPLITKKTSTDNEYEYYEAQSPGFSLFAITGETVLVTFSQEQPSLIFAENYFYVAYNSNEKGNNDIFIKKYDFNWNLIKKKQITTGNGSQWAPSIEFANNHLYVAYDSAETGNSEVFIKIYDQDLNYIDKKQITNNEKSEEEYPSLCKHNNILYIAYASDESGDSEIFLERYDLNLNPIGERKRINYGYDPTIISTENNLYIAYKKSPKLSEEIFIEKYDLNLTSRHNRIKATFFQNKVYFPFMMRVGNNLYLAYDLDQEGNYDIFVKQYDLNLNQIREKQITKSLKNEHYPTITFAKNDFYVAYMSEETGNWDIYVEKFNPSEITEVDTSTPTSTPTPTPDDTIDEIVDKFIEFIIGIVDIVGIVGFFIIGIVSIVGIVGFYEWRRRNNDPSKILTNCVCKVLDPDDKSIVSTGFFVDSDGYILTCYHVALGDRDKPPSFLQIEYKGRTYTAKYLEKQSNPNKDIAVLKVECADFHDLSKLCRDGFPHPPLSRRWRPGNPIFCLGYQESNIYPDGVLIKGKIHPDDPIQRINFGSIVLECFIIKTKDHHIMEGMSGAPILNAKTKKVIAMVTGTDRTKIVGIIRPGSLIEAEIPQNKGFAILLENVRDKWPEFEYKFYNKFYRVLKKLFNLLEEKT